MDDVERGKSREKKVVKLKGGRGWEEKNCEEEREEGTGGYKKKERRRQERKRDVGSRGSLRVRKEGREWKREEK